MSDCTTQVAGKWYVKAAQNAQEAGNRFGPVHSQETAEQLLCVLASRADIVKAVIEVEVA